MSQKIVLATSNLGKHNEISPLLNSCGFDVHLQSEFAVSDIEETGLTFIENAIIKARHAAQIAKLPALADDSGLVIPALSGRPGIYSARYAGQDASYPEKFKQLFSELDALDPKLPQVPAYFYCVLVFMRTADDPSPMLAEGRWHGQIRAPSGTGGFGYDPIFFLPQENCTAAELSIEAKSKISHRGLALRSLLQQMNS